MRGFLGFGLALVLVTLASDATSQPAPTSKSFPSRDIKLPPQPPQLISWFNFAGGSLEDKIPPPPNLAKRVVTLGPGGSIDSSKSFIKIDARHGLTKAALMSRTGEFGSFPEFTVALFFFIDAYYPGGASGSQTCSWHRILTHTAFDFEINKCNYPDPYVLGGTIKFTGSVVAKKWTHVALTRSPAESKFYLNGGLVGTGPSPPLKTNISAEESIYFGVSLLGAIDEFRFYKGVLDASAIAALQQAGPSIDKTPDISAPIAPPIVK